MIAGLAFRNVLRNKERSLLTLVGVVLAIGSFVALVSLAAGFTQRVERELGSREVHMYVTVSRSSTLPVSPLGGVGVGGVALPRELSKLFQVEGVRAVTPIIRTSLDGPRSVIPVLALPLEHAEFVFKGARFSTLPSTAEWKREDAEEVPEPTPTPIEPTPSPDAEASPSPAPSPATVAGRTPQELAKLPGVFIGQGLQRDMAEALHNGSVSIEEVEFRKVGDMGSLGFLDYSILAPVEAFLDQRPERGVHEFWLTLEDESQSERLKMALQGEIESYLSEHGLLKEYEGARRIKVLTRREYLRSAQEYLGYGWLLQVAVSMVGVLIAVTASMNTMLMSTYERLGEYATLRAVGASRRVISLTIIFEAIFLNVTGGLLGLLFGYLATGVLDKAVTLLLEIPYPMAGVTPALLLQALGLSFFVGLLGSLIPCFVVSRIDLVAELRKGL